MILLIDVGNTRIKWALVKNGQWLQQGHVFISKTVELTEQWQGLPMPNHIAGCYVAAEDIVQQLEALVTRCFSQPVVWLQVKAACYGVKNYYSNTGKSGPYISTLGTDRWASLVGVHHLYPGNQIVINAGTAMTIDALTDKGEFLGGLIVPGIRLMQTALNTQTARLPDTQGQYDLFPKTTADAIYTGIVTALASVIDTMAKRLAEHRLSPGVHCIISGGDARLVSPHLHYPYQVVDDLVLRGLTIIAQNDLLPGQAIKIDKCMFSRQKKSCKTTNK